MAQGAVSPQKSAKFPLDRDEVGTIRGENCLFLYGIPDSRTLGSPHVVQINSQTFANN